MAVVATDAQSMVHSLTWADIIDQCKSLADRWRPKGFIAGVYGIPTGGCFVALEVARQLDLSVLDAPQKGSLNVDDLVDSGNTFKRSLGPGCFFDALYRKPHSPEGIAPHATLVSGWVQFPWEHENSPCDAIVRVLEYVGEDPNREGLKGTPERVLKTFKEMTVGYDIDPAKLLKTVFDEQCDEMIVVSGIPFDSLCEHHLLPFSGTVTVGYIPLNGKIIGLSKIPRLVECFARRLQIQERMTSQIATELNNALSPVGIGVVVEAHHLCMSLRGIKKNGIMKTSCLLGLMKDDARARQEFLDFTKQKG